MKCPFLIKRRDIYGGDGKKVNEEIELLECMKNECMVYDSATKLCSLLSSNMKTGVLIDDYKKGVKELKEVVFQRAEALGENFSQTLEKLREALASRLDIQKKQIEVMVLGFDRLQEAFNSKFDDLKGGLENAGESVVDKLSALGESTDRQGEGFKSALQSLQDKFSEFNGTSTRLADELLGGIRNMSEKIKDEVSDLKTQNAGALKNLAARFDELGKTISEISAADSVRSQALVDKITSIDDVMKNVVNELRFEASTTADRFRDELSKYIEGVRNEIIGLKNGQGAGLSNLQGELVQLRDLFTKSSGNLETMTDMMKNLNSNYVESLGKIAGLAEGMRQGVEDTGESMSKALTTMAAETRNQIAGVAARYEKTFGDVAKLVEKFEDVRNRLRDMTKELTQDFKSTLDRQTSLSGHTKDILESMRTLLTQQEQRFEKEQELSKKKTALDHFDRATLYYYRGNYELALNEIDKAVEIDETAEYLNLKGLVLAELGRYDDSKKNYLEALKLEPNLSELHNNLGLLFLKMRKLDEAVLSFEESLKKNVNNALAYVNLGKALIEQEKFDEAISAYKHALEIDPANQEAKEAVRLYKEGKIAS
jgi:tetratricopeptide (TPR) repeat protein